MRARWPVPFALALLAGAILAMGPVGSGEARPQPSAPARKVFAAGALNGVSVSDLATGREIAEIRTGVLPHAVLLSPDRQRLYVSHIGSQSVAEIDTGSARLLRQILVGDVPDLPAHRRFSPQQLRAGGTCFGCHAHAVGTAPNAMAWEGGRLLVSETRRRSVAAIDLASGRTVARHAFGLPGNATPAHLFVHPRTHAIWVLHRHAEFMPETGAPDGHDRPSGPGQFPSWLTVHAPGFARETARIRLPWSVPADAALSPDGNRLYVSFRSSNTIGVFDARAPRLLRHFEVGTAPAGLALSPDGRTLYAACSFSQPAVVQAIDTRTGEVRVSMGVPPAPQMLWADRGEIYASLAGVNRVARIDPERLAITAEYPAGHQPVGLAVAP